MKKNYVIGGAVILVIIIIFLVMQNQKNKATLAANQAAASNPLSANNYAGGPAWLQALNSPAIASLLGGFGAGVGSNISSGQTKG